VSDLMKDLNNLREDPYKFTNSFIIHIAGDAVRKIEGYEKLISSLKESFQLIIDNDYEGDCADIAKDAIKEIDGE